MGQQYIQFILKILKEGLIGTLRESNVKTFFTTYSPLEVVIVVVVVVDIAVVVVVVVVVVVLVVVVPVVEGSVTFSNKYIWDYDYVWE